MIDIKDYSPDGSVTYNLTVFVNGEVVPAQLPYPATPNIDESWSFDVYVKTYNQNSLQHSLTMDELEKLFGPSLIDIRLKPSKDNYLTIGTITINPYL